MKYFEVTFTDGTTICCKGERVPNKEEATEFCAEDVKQYGNVVTVVEVSLEDALGSYDTDDIDNWPVFK